MNTNIQGDFHICISVPLRTKDTEDFKLQRKSVDTTHSVNVQEMPSPEMYLLMLRYLQGITEAVVQRCSVKKLFLKISYNSQKAPMLECLFNKVEGLRPISLLKRDSITSVSSVNFARFFRTPILYNICERLLLVLVRISLVWRAANLSIFYIIDCKSSQYLTYWNAVFN